MKEGIFSKLEKIWLPCAKGTTANTKESETQAPSNSCSTITSTTSTANSLTETVAKSAAELETAAVIAESASVETAQQPGVGNTT